MNKVDILAGLLGLVGFVVMYWLSIIYVGPFVGGMVGFFAGIITFVLVSFLVMVIGRAIEDYNV